MNFKKIGVIVAGAVYVLCVACCFYLLYYSRTGESVVTPWQAINQLYIYLFAVATFLLGLLIFFHLKTSVLLLFLILHSFLLHSYLPLTHDLLYGADGWRHIANEQRWLDGKEWKQAELIEGGQASGFSEAIGRMSYSSLWGTSVLVAKVFKIDLITVSKWLVPVIWSIALPLLLFKLGTLFKFGERQSLLLGWLSFLPFAWQAAGSFTLPVNLGFLVWLAALVLLLQRLQNPRRKQLLILMGMGVFLLFGYSLYVVLFAMGWALVEVILRLQTADSRFNIPIMVGMGLLSALVIPVLEFVAHYSFLDLKINWLAQIKQLFGNFTALYLATGPRPHDIATGNIIFNQVPGYAFVVNAFTLWRWWLVGFMVLFIAAIHAGLFIAFKKNDRAHTWLAMLWVSVVGSYVIGRYVLSGEQILSRRLDVVVALLFLLLFMVFLDWARSLSVIKNLSRSARLFLVPCSLFFLSIAMAASYSLGPDTQTVSAAEYQAMKQVWVEEKNNQRHCVLADTYPLLALEAISGKEIIGGGFPINQYFAQPERERFLKELQPYWHNTNVLKEAAAITKADQCWVIHDGVITPVQF